MCNSPVFVRQCRASYGVVFDELFDPESHANHETYINPADKRCYAKDRIHWMIDQGAQMDGNHRFDPFRTSRVVNSNTETVFWIIKIVKYAGKLDTRPNSCMGQPNIDTVKQIPCRFSPTLEDVKIIRKRYRRLKLKSYWEVPYEIRLDVGPADLKFELWFNNRAMGAESDGIPIDFMQNIKEDVHLAVSFRDALKGAYEVQLR